MQEVLDYFKSDQEPGRIPSLALSNLSYSTFPSDDKVVRLVSRKSHRLNVTRRGISDFKLRSWYHSILDYSWGKFFLILSIGFFLVNLLFGLLYFIDPSGIEGVSQDRNLLDLFLCFCFSAQTITTIGYGKMAPDSVYIQVLVLFESFASFVIGALLTGILFSKMSRPTRISKQIRFGTSAVVNREAPAYIDGSSCLEPGKYVSGKYNVLSIRIANTRRSQLCNSQLRLLLLRKDISAKSKFDIHELDYEIYHQIGRPRGVNYAIPYLAFPWVVTHTIDEKSPLFAIDPQHWHDPDNHFELIVVLDGVDESVSMNVQARWSYVPSEIVLNARFNEITTLDEKTGRYEIDFSKFDDIEYIPNVFATN